MKNKILAAMAAVIVLLCGTSAYANSNNAPSEDYSGYSALTSLSDTAAISTAAPTVTARPSRTISTEGTGHVVDNITNSDDLQFISVTAKDGSVFFVVIDKQNTNDNVYFLNKVDVSDLEALTEDGKLKSSSVAAPTPAPSVSPTPEPGVHKTAAEQNQTKSPVSSMVLILILAAIAAAAVGGYYFKVIIPKKKLEQADDLEDFEFEDSEDVINENNVE